MSETPAQSAYLTSVYQNAYQYNEIETMGIVYKNTDSTFASLIGDSTNIGGVIQWTGSNWNFAKLSDIEGGFNWVGTSAINGVVVNSGSSYTQLAINDGETVAINYADNTLSAIPLNALATEAAVSSLTTSGTYVINRDASGAWTYAPIPAYIAEPTLATSAEAYVYVKDASGANSFVRATPVNVYGQDLSNKIVYVNANSEWAGVTLPDSYTIPTGTQQEFHMVASNNNGVMTYMYEPVPDSPLTSGFNYSLASASVSGLNLGTSDVVLTDAIDHTYVPSVNYTANVTLDIFVKDITEIVGALSANPADIAKLPVLKVYYGASSNNKMIGSYVIKPNQPVQTVNVSKIITTTAEDTNVGQITVKVVYDGIPETPDADFIQFYAATFSANMTPCGHSPSA